MKCLMTYFLFWMRLQTWQQIPEWKSYAFVGMKIWDWNEHIERLDSFAKEMCIYWCKGWVPIRSLHIETICWRRMC